MTEFFELGDEPVDSVKVGIYWPFEEVSVPKKKLNYGS